MVLSNNSLAIVFPSTSCNSWYENPPLLHARLFGTRESSLAGNVTAAYQDSGDLAPPVRDQRAVAVRSAIDGQD